MRIIGKIHCVSAFVAIVTRACICVAIVFFAPSLAMTRATAAPISPKRLAVDVSIGPPSGIATDQLGNVYFSSPNLVLKLDGRGTLTRVAGKGPAGYSGDGGPATEALLNFPDSYPERDRDPFDFSELVAGMAADNAGNLYIADVYNDRVRKVDATGVITTIVQPSTFPERWPAGVATDAAGSLYISYEYGALIKRTPGGGTTTLASNDCGKDLAPGLCAPQQIAIDAGGNIFVPDGYCRIRKVQSDGTIVTIAGDEGPTTSSFHCGFTGDGGPATRAALSWPYGVAVDIVGNVYIADTYADRIRKVDATTGTITTIAGGSRGYSGDGGPATEARLNLPHGVAVDTAGNLYVADTGNNRIRMISANGVISTVAGNGSADPFSDAPPSAPAAVVVVEFYNPDLDNYFIAADPAERAYVESGAVGNWQRTGEEFNAGGLDPVCRFAGNRATNPATGRPYGPNSHFYTADPGECANLKARFSTSAPSWAFEGNEFFITAPVNGRCAAELLPVFRAYNNGFSRGLDSNHRITSNVSAYLATVAAGWIGEGVVMCAPQ